MKAAPCFCYLIGGPFVGVLAKRALLLYQGPDFLRKGSYNRIATRLYVRSC